jgi:hypothetical protein
MSASHPSATRAKEQQSQDSAAQHIAATGATPKQAKSNQKAVERLEQLAQELEDLRFAYQREKSRNEELEEKLFAVTNELQIAKDDCSRLQKLLVQLQKDQRNGPTSPGRANAVPAPVVDEARRGPAGPSISLGRSSSASAPTSLKLDPEVEAKSETKVSEPQTVTRQEQQMKTESHSQSPDPSPIEAKSPVTEDGDNPLEEHEKLLASLKQQQYSFGYEA